MKAIPVEMTSFKARWTWTFERQKHRLMDKKVAADIIFRKTNAMIFPDDHGLQRPIARSPDTPDLASVVDLINAFISGDWLAQSLIPSWERNRRLAWASAGPNGQRRAS